VGGTTEFTVRSPTATASVRGTAFEFDGIRLKVDEGRVHVSGGDRSGTYVGAGHLALTDIETGRTAGAAETAREELSPALPAGTESAPEIVTEPSTGDIDAGFDWQ
jgi:ferric-dicitrate binding protein FerR (iron transport regulator)